MNHLTETQLNEYLDQMLDERAHQNVKVHLDACDKCRAQLDELEILFSILADLPDMPLARDLTPGVLARLPDVPQIPALWRQPVFVLQALLTIILLTISLPLLRTLGSLLTAWVSELMLPTVQFPPLSEMLAQLPAFLAWKPQLRFDMPALPTMLSLPSDPDSTIMLLLVIFSGTLWMIGNLSLLRSRPEVQE